MDRARYFSKGNERLSESQLSGVTDVSLPSAAHCHTLLLVSGAGCQRVFAHAGFSRPTIACLVSPSLLCSLCARVASRLVNVCGRGRPEPRVRAGPAPRSEVHHFVARFNLRPRTVPLCAPAAGWRGSCSLELQLLAHRGPIGPALFSWGRCLAEPSIHPSCYAAPEEDAKISCLNALRL